METESDTASDTAPPAEWLRPAMAVNGIGSFHWDIAADTLEWDQLASRIIGVGPDELDRDPRRLLALLRPADAELVLERVRRAVADCGQAGAYLRISPPDGTDRAVRFRARVVADPESGEPTRMVGFVWDADAEQQKRSRNDRAAEARRMRDVFLQEASRRLAEARTAEDVAQAFAELRFPGPPPAGRVLGVLDSGRFSVVGVAGYRESGIRQLEGQGKGSPHPGAVALQSRAPLFVGSPEEYRERFPEAWPFAEKLGRRAWAFLPLQVEGRVIGICVLSWDHEREFEAADRALLTTVSGLVAQALARARLHDAEHELAAGLQQVLLPRRVPETAGLETAVRYLPAGPGLQIGGDWYDVVPLSGGTVALVVGDVQGHDVHAAGVMGQLRVALRAYAAEGHPAASVLSRAGRFMADLDTGLFATCLYAEVDPVRGAVDVVRAGHPEPIVRHPDGSSTVKVVPGGLPLGIDPDEQYPVTRIDLDPDEVLVLATDGLLESRTRDEAAALDHLRSVLAGELASPPDLDRLADRLVDDAGEAPDREDDIALLLMRWERPGGEGDAPVRTLRRTVAQADVAQISAVRADLREACRRWGVEEFADVAELLVSELVTNALVHTDGDTVLTVKLFGSGPSRRLRAEVEDDSDLWLRRRTPGEQASSGRGLLLVEELADSWGVQPRGNGKRVWFELSGDGV